MDNSEKPKKKGNPNLYLFGNRFSSTNQPDKHHHLLTKRAIKGLTKTKPVIIEGEDMETGEVRQFRVKIPTADTLVMVWLQQCAKGNMKALEMLLDRVEGKLALTVNPQGQQPPEQDETDYVILSTGEKIAI